MTSQKNFELASQESLIKKVKTLDKLMMGPYVFEYEPFTVLDENFRQKAQEDLRETPENIVAGLEGLRELLRGEPDLVILDNDEFLTKFLRPCKWYSKSAFELMKRLYKFQQNYPQYNDDLIPSNDKAAFIAGILAPVPLRTDYGERVLIIQGGSKWNPKKVSLTQLFRAVRLSLEAAITEPKTQIAGVHVVLDMEGLTLSHVTYFTPAFARAVLEWVQRCLPCRMKGIHIVNQPYIFNMIFAIFKPFIHEKLRKRIHFHGTNKQSLFNLVQPNVFPKSYGGSLDYETDVAAENFWKYLCYFNDNFAASNKFGYIKNK